MAYIKKLKDNELIGGTDNTDVYPVTSTEAVYNRENVSQEYINNHVDGSKIVDGTITNNKIADSTISMGKLDNDVQTKIQQGTQRAWTPKGTFELGEKYDFNDLVYSEEDNSSHISLQANNEGHVPGVEGEEAWWMKVVDGSYVNVMVEELEQAIAQAIGKAQEDIDDAIADANAAAQAAWGVAYQAVDPTMDETSTNPVQNKVVTKEIYTNTEMDLSAISIGNYRLTSAKKWTANTAEKHYWIPCAAGAIFRVTGGTTDFNYAFMKTHNNTANANANVCSIYTGTLPVCVAGQTITITAPSDATGLALNKVVNSSDVNISKIERVTTVKQDIAAIKDDLVDTEAPVLSLGKAYDLNQIVRKEEQSADLFVLTQPIYDINKVAVLRTSQYYADGTDTYVCNTAVAAFDRATAYADDALAVGSQTVLTLVINTESFSANKTVQVKLGTCVNYYAVTTAMTATDIAALIVSVKFSGWTLTDNENGTITAICDTLGNKSGTFTFNANSSGLVITSTVVNAGSESVNKYAEATNSWTDVSVAELVENGNIAAITIATLFTFTSPRVIDDKLRTPLNNYIMVEPYSRGKYYYSGVNTGTTQGYISKDYRVVPGEKYYLFGTYANTFNHTLIVGWSEYEKSNRKNILTESAGRTITLDAYEFVVPEETCLITISYDGKSVKGENNGINLYRKISDVYDEYKSLENDSWKELKPVSIITGYAFLDASNASLRVNSAGIIYIYKVVSGREYIVQGKPYNLRVFSFADKELKNRIDVFPPYKAGTSRTIRYSMFPTNGANYIALSTSFSYSTAQRYKLYGKEIDQEENIRSCIEYNQTQINKLNPRQIECWGDSLTHNNGFGSVGFCYYLEQKLNSLFVQRYGLYGNGIYTVHNNGLTGDNVFGMRARQGSLPIISKTTVVIPASGGNVNISITDPYNHDGTLFYPWIRANAGDMYCYVGGVRCQFVSGNPLKIKQAVASDSDVTLYAGDTIMVDAAKVRRGGIQIFWIGTNGGHSSTEDLINHNRLAAEFSGTEKCIFMSPSTKVSGADAMTAIENEYKKAFGDKFFDVRQYFLTRAFDDAGMTPTEGDMTDISNGIVPRSFRLGADNVHLTSKGQELISEQLYRRMMELNYLEDN